MYIVGAGCGDFDLITMRGAEYIRHCDVLVYDSLIDVSLLGFAPETAEKICVGKRSGRHSEKQENINEILVEKAREGKTVVRLKGGDPFVFGRGGEEIETLKSADIPFDIVPGISSSIAVPELAGIPVTHRNLSRSVHIITGHTAHDTLPENIKKCAETDGTLVFLMGLRNLPDIVKNLIQNGKSEDTPVAVVSNGACAKNQTVRGTLSTICENVKSAEVVPPAVIVVGETAKFDFAPTITRPLKNVSVTVTGTRKLSDKLGKMLTLSGAEGSKIYDVDGNEFIDYICSWGPNILGHKQPDVIKTVTSACQNGLTFGACHSGEIELAELIRKNMPSIEMLRLVNSGTEAVMSAIRAARGFTKRDKIVKFEGCYHGHSDGLLVKGGSGLLTNSIPNSAGVPKGYTDTTLLAKYNDEESVQQLFDNCGDEIACVIVEPCAANMGVVPPKKGFLKFLREITEKHDSLLIFDEVITGFRLSLGGAQKLYGVKPDLTTLGKIVGGGMPLAVYGGRKEIMECVAPLGSVYQAGTLSGNPVAVSAGIATLKILEKNKDSIYPELERKSAKIENAMKNAGLNVNRVGSIMTAFFTDKKVVDYDTATTADTKRYAEYYNHLLENGIYAAPSQFEAMFVSFAHTEDDIEKTCQVIESFK